MKCGSPGSSEPMYGLEDLALALGGSASSFTGDLLRLIAKAQSTPLNLEGLRRGFPRIVRAYELWMATSPPPTGDQLLAALDVWWAGRNATPSDDEDGAVSR